MRTEAGQAAAIRRLAVIGVGLMGGSLALAAHKEWPEVTVVGYDSDPQALGEALSRGVLSEAADSAGAAARAGGPVGSHGRQGCPWSLSAGHTARPTIPARRPGW